MIAPPQRVRNSNSMYRHSAESKLKMSLAKKGKKYPKIAESKKGHKMPLATKLAIIKANTGRIHKPYKWTDEQKRNFKAGFQSDSTNPMWKGGISTYERKLYLNGRRRVKKLNAEGSHTFDEWELLKKQYGYKCPCCGKKEPEIRLTEDHIIPLDRGGSDFIENIQPLCKSCNCKKHTKTYKYPIKI